MNPGQNRKSVAANIDLSFDTQLIIKNTVLLTKWQLVCSPFSPKIFNTVPPDSMIKCQTIKIKDRQNWWQLEF